MGTIINIANNKGGCGKTVVSVNLATALAIKKKRVLVIDADPQSNTTTALLPGDVHLKDTAYELFNPNNDQIPNFQTLIYPTIRKFLYLIPNVLETAGHEISLIEGLTKGRPIYSLLRKRCREYCLNNFDYVLIDNMPSLGIFLTLTLAISDSVIIPVDVGSAASMSGVKNILDLMKTVRKEINPDLVSAKVLTNRVDKRISACMANIDNINMRFGDENIFKSSIPSSADFQSAEALPPNTVFNFNPKSKGSHAFRKIADEFLRTE
jgi:chromosome partitioning protein